MNIKVTHDTSYHFDKPVFLEPQFIRLLPKNVQGRDLVSFELIVDPAPAGLRVLEDEENNRIHFAWFDGLTTELRITSESLIRVKDYNPFEFIVHPVAFNTIPFTYSAEQRKQLSIYLDAVPVSNALTTFAENLKDNESNTVNFLTALTASIHTHFSLIHREEGPPMSPDDTFKIKRGSCRDLSWMQINLLRSIGVAARYVSGYFYIDIDNFELHAWVEAYIPGPGWLGFDPSYGIVAGNTHLPLAAAANYKNTMPVTGSFRGEAISTLNTRVLMESVEQE